MKDKGKFIYSLMFSLVGLVFFLLSSGSQVKAADSEMSVSVQDAVLKADTNAYVVDQTTKSKISTNKDVLDSQAASYVDTTSVNPGDSLEFNYLMNFVSGEATANMTATIELPDNVTFATGTIGKVVYLSTDGKTTTSVDIPDTDLDNKTLTVPIDDIGTGKDYASARIVLSAKAGDSGKTVDQSHIDYEADNFDDVADTPSFDIKDASNSIVATADNTSVNAYDGDTFNLTGTMDYKKDDGVTFKNENMYIYTTIDGVAQLPFQDTASADKQFKLIMNALAIGDHKITVQVIQPNYNGGGETIVSNVLNYDVNISANSLIITKDKSFDGGYTVNNNNPVDIKGTYEHADGSPAHGTKKGLTIMAQVTSKADTDKPNVQDEYQVYAPGATGTKYNDDGTFNFSVDPVVYKMGNGGPVSDQSLTYDQYIAKHGFQGLEVGKNIVTVTLKDAQGHESDPTQFVINVPDIKFNLSIGSQNIFSFNSPNLLGGQYSIPVSLSYSKSDYQFSLNGVFSQNTLNNKESRTVISGVNDLVTEYNGSTDVPMYDFVPKSYYGFSNPDDPVIPDQPYPGLLRYYDAYGRESNTVDYNVTFRSHYVDIKTDDNYKFKSYKNYDNQHNIDRDGKWGVKVESYRSSWTLRASATPFYQTFSDGRAAVKLNGYMVYIKPTDGGTTDSTSMENQQVTLASYEGSLTNGNIITTDIASQWTEDTGIKLVPYGSGVGSYLGTYKSTIAWEATDSV
ncbi:hypothetical protein [Companilactobacillus keshanensis]|uniref:WxL domain-containing protein n=1 Tax=Companilactobacillus keshanensis TaxID=2486003 RepID=A0ABW4BSP9_9LACO|nr:hypothetical protein [Companilactobacillus keshanensis]